MYKSERTPAERRQRTRCYIIGAVLGLLATPFAVMLFDRREPLTLHQGQMVPEVVRPCQVVDLVWSADENFPSDGEYERRITEDPPSGRTHVFAREKTVYHLADPSKPHQTFTRPFVIPCAIGQGWVTYQTIGVRWRRGNFMQQHLWPIPFEGQPVRFYVVKEKPEP